MSRLATVAALALLAGGDAKMGGSIGRQPREPKVFTKHDQAALDRAAAKRARRARARLSVPAGTDKEA